ADFQLAQNYPNPFNGTTIIPYQIQAPGNINLSIYNALGQLVINLVETHALPGAYSIRWNGKDQSGSAVSNGFYVAVLTHNGRQAAIKMLYLK
ncbi:MAG TPA: T9SS type A sorting domain-containing protein, partial [candidate division Zixibacteria bacterium]|nr:T9SS type A sorting domain-containing protein [candidate division Zixibacteria bacterium]